MSEFSKFCKLLRENSGMTIYQISKVSGMERTALNRIILGKRLPKQWDMERFCAAIRANEKEKEKLWELYMMEKMGKRRYENCQYIKQMLEELDQDVGAENRIRWQLDETVYADQTGSLPFAQGQEEVEALIYCVLEQVYCKKGRSKIYTNFPAKEKILFPAIHFLSNQYKRSLALIHFLILNINPEKYYDAACNLKILRQTLSWKFREEIDYIPYYTYSSVMLHDLEMQLMPYYLVTDSCVLFVSSDFRQCILLEEADSVAFYKRKIEKQCGRQEPLFCEEASEEGQDFSNKMTLTLKHLDIWLNEKGIWVGMDAKGVSVVVRESSLCEAFHDFSDYIDEIKNSAHGSAHIEGQAAKDIS